MALHIQIVSHQRLKSHVRIECPTNALKQWQHSLMHSVSQIRTLDDMGCVDLMIRREALIIDDASGFQLGHEHWNAEQTFKSQPEFERTPISDLAVKFHAAFDDLVQAG